MDHPVHLKHIRTLIPNGYESESARNSTSPPRPNRRLKMDLHQYSRVAGLHTPFEKGIPPLNDTSSRHPERATSAAWVSLSGVADASFGEGKSDSDEGMTGAGEWGS